MKFKDPGFVCICPEINRIEKKKKKESYLCKLTLFSARLKN